MSSRQPFTRFALSSCQRPSPLWCTEHALERLSHPDLRRPAQSYFDDLNVVEIPNARRLIRICADALKNEVDGRAAFEGYHPHGLDLVRWIEDPSSRPAPVVLSESVISQPLIFVAQCAQFVSLERLGFASENIADWAVATTGHSQGILTAMLAAEGHRFEPLAERAAKIACYLVWQGIHMQASYGRAPGHDRPMVAITGQTREEIESALDGVEAVISLANAPRRYVLSGHPSELERAVDRLTVRSKAEHAAFDKGQAPRPRPLGVEWLAVSAPFHSPAMADALPLMHESMRRFAFETRSQDLVVPML